jgi:glycerol-3-phosphate O-acyltransferase
MTDELKEIVLSYPKLKVRIDEKRITKEKIFKILTEIAATYSTKVMQYFSKGLDISLERLYDGINFNYPADMDFKSLCEENNVVLVPNHQSHADYLAINYMVFKHFGFPLYVAGGINLNVFLVGELFRRSGCFFIRRTFQSDISYRLVLEAYLYYLMKTGKTIEFFFEGGRTRSGKLLSPRFGLYQMLLESHSTLPLEKRKKLLFVPVSIVHEFVPEQKTLSQELEGGKKQKENLFQVFKVLKLFSHQFGNVHINLGHPIEGPLLDNCEADEKRVLTQRLAFNCFRRVGKNLLVTPTALLSLVLLEEPSGALKWKDISSKCHFIVNFCKKFKIPFVNSLKNEYFNKTIERAMEILVGNEKVDIIKGRDAANIFYSIKIDARKELLYSKNSILHHFLIPWTIHSAWIKVFKGKIENVDELKDFFLKERDQLKHEFYLPTTKEFLQHTLFVISEIIGRKIRSLEECLDLEYKELYLVASSTGLFARSGSYLFEGYYLAALSIKELNEKPSLDGFKFDHFKKSIKDLYNNEKTLDRFIKYPESCSLPLMKTSLKYFTHQGIIENSGGGYFVINGSKLDNLIKEFEEKLIEGQTFNVNPEV